MRKRSVFLVGGLGVSLLGATMTYGDPPASELRNGRWEKIASVASQPVNPDPTLEKIDGLLRAGKADDAHDLLRQWIKTHGPSDPHRDQASFLFGKTYFQEDDRLHAFFYFDEVMDSWPDSKWFYPALEMQFRIADDYLSGHKKRFLGIPMFGAEDEAIDMLYRVQQRSPGSPLAEKALLRTADYYYSQSDFDLAHDAYTYYVKIYPRSPLVAQVRLRSAFASLAQFRGIRFDATAILDARAELADVAVAHPQLAEEQNVRGVIELIDRTLASKFFEQADFFRRTHEPNGAVYMYRYVVVSYPESQQAKAATAALKKMPAKALDQPEPVSDQAAADAAPQRSEFDR